MCSCGPCFLWSRAIKFVILNEKKQQFLKLNWHLTGWRQATKANIRGQEIKMKRCEKYADNRMAVKWLLRWNWIPSQGGCFCSLSHFLLLFFQINSLCIDCYDLRGGPQCRCGRRSKWIKMICCKGSWKWRWEEGRWSGRGQEGRQGWVNGMCWQGVEGGCWLEGGKQVGRWAQGKHKEKVTVNRSQERRGRCAKPDTERQGSTGDRELFHYVSPYFLHSRLFHKS